MIVHLGPFHPHLEDALVRETLAVKSTDPWAPLLILVPSDAIRRRVAWLLAGERGLAFLNMSILSFHQLARRLGAEITEGVDMELQDDGAFEELVHGLLASRPYGRIFAGLQDTPGGCAALWQTLRDLKDARVEPSSALDAVEGRLFGSAAAPRLHAVLALYRDVLEAAQAAGWRDYTDLDVTAAEHVPRSVFLSSFVRVFYYGFYDLTQAQFDFFRAVARRCETALFFPLIPTHPGWEFSERFYRRYVAGLVDGRASVSEGGTSAVVDRLFNETAATPPPDESGIAVVTCCGAGDEVLVTAKEILRLVEEEGVAFADIGVVARSLDVYGPLVAREFTRHAIPFVSTAKTPLAQCPFVHAVGCFIDVASGAPSRERVIDLLVSPYFRFESRPGEESPRPDLWDAISRRAGISDGLATWTRLDRIIKDDDRGELPAASSPGQAAILRRLAFDLERMSAALPAEASYSRHASAWTDALEKVLEIVSVGRAKDRAGTTFEVRQADALLTVLDQLSALDAIRSSVTREQFIRSVRRRIETALLAPDRADATGVSVCDAMAARGVPFRVLFILGLNEGVFPRTIREDAFLRDRDRRVLETDLGYKIPEKLAGYDEERLLFSLLIGAARQRLYLLTQRSDEGGRALAPSWYRDELSRAAGLGDVRRRERSVPRRIRDKFETAPFDRLVYLTPGEAVLRAVFDGRDPDRFMDDDSWKEMLARSRGALASMEAPNAGLGVYDGWVGALPWLRTEVSLGGLSATALEMYARCPTQFFLRRVLGVEPWPMLQDGVGPAAWGRLCHDILARMFQAGVRAEPRETCLARLDALCDQVFAAYARVEPTGYPLVWDVETKRIKALLRKAVRHELEELESSGFVPERTEAQTTGTLPIRGGVPIQGRLDRVDRHPDGRVRVVDYKVRFGELKGLPDPAKEALQARRLQPPVYAVLGGHYVEDAPGRAVSGPVVEVSVHVLTTEGDETVVRRRYEPDAETQDGIARTLTILIDGIEQGRFAMIPEASYCSRCDVPTACRRRHWPSRQRARGDERMRPIIALRQASPARTTAES